MKIKLKAFHDTLNPKTLHDEILCLRKELFCGAKFTRSDIWYAYYDDFGNTYLLSNRMCVNSKTLWHSLFPTGKTME